MSGTSAVNEHYLDRVVAIADATGVEATEDIVAGNGLKLVAKGARIDSRVRDRLLAHKLSKPLESMLRVVDGVDAAKLDAVAEELLDTRPLLAAVCGRAGKAVVSALRHLSFSTPVESLLGVYQKDSATRLPHAVAVALMAGAMSQELPGGAAGLTTTILAGLLHDVGELYIDPAILKPTRRLTSEEMKHIQTHPLVAGHLLRDMPGAGASVAELVAHHHERRDGFGYPFGLTAAKLSLGAQALGVAELMMALIESGKAPAERAAVAMKLIPGEFDQPLLDRIVRASRVAPTGDVAALAGPASANPDELAHRVVVLHETLRGLDSQSSEFQQRVSRSSPALQALAEHALERCGRISRAFSSTGLDVPEDDSMAAVIADMDAAVRFEVDVVLRELEWRLREVKREVRRRAERLPPAEMALVAALVDEAKATARNAAHAPTVDAG